MVRTCGRLRGRGPRSAWTARPSGAATPAGSRPPTSSAPRSNWTLFRPETDKGHGRLETRALWASTALNASLRFPHGGQVFCLRRTTTVLATGATRTETVYGGTSLAPPRPGSSRSSAPPGHLALAPRRGTAHRPRALAGGVVRAPDDPPLTGHCPSAECGTTLTRPWLLRERHGECCRPPT